MSDARPPEAAQPLTRSGGAMRHPAAVHEDHPGLAPRTGVPGAAHSAARFGFPALIRQATADRRRAECPPRAKMRLRRRYLPIVYSISTCVSFTPALGSALPVVRTIPAMPASFPVPPVMYATVMVLSFPGPALRASTVPRVKNLSPLSRTYTL